MNKELELKMGKLKTLKVNAHDNNEFISMDIIYHKMSKDVISLDGAQSIIIHMKPKKVK